MAVDEIPKAIVGGIIVLLILAGIFAAANVLGIVIIIIFVIAIICTIVEALKNQAYTLAGIMILILIAMSILKFVHLL